MCGEIEALRDNFCVQFAMGRKKREVHRATKLVLSSFSETTSYLHNFHNSPLVALILQNEAEKMWKADNEKLPSSN
jgi:hypothetical protein